MWREESTREKRSGYELKGHKRGEGSARAWSADSQIGGNNSQRGNCINGFFFNPEFVAADTTRIELPHGAQTYIAVYCTQ